jgi:hypothetical protein
MGATSSRLPVSELTQQASNSLLLAFASMVILGVFTAQFVCNVMEACFHNAVPFWM